MLKTHPDFYEAIKQGESHFSPFVSFVFDDMAKEGKFSSILIFWNIAGGGIGETGRNHT